MSLTVLLVCPEELRAQLSIRMLKAAQVEVRRIERPDEVEGILHSTGGIGAVLCDWRLPIAQSCEWLAKWRAVASPSRPHYILMSDRLPTPAEAKTLFEQGAADVWVRPLPDYLLVPRLKVWLGTLPGGVLDPGSAGAGSSPGQMTSSLIAANFDIETQMMGREMFLEVAEGMFAGARRLNLLAGCLAIAIRNTHEVLAMLGPQGLRESNQFMASELKRIKRREDFVGRWDETIFVVISYFPDFGGVQKFASRILGHLEQSRFPHAAKMGPLRFTVSGAYGPSRDYALARQAIETIVQHTRTSAEG